MAQKTNRSLMIPLRVTPAEKAMLEERAGVAGLNVSEYLRREAGIGRYGSTDLRRAKSRREPRESGQVQPEAKATRPERGEDFEARVEQLARQRGIPRRSAETLVRRADQAKAALG